MRLRLQPLTQYTRPWQPKPLSKPISISTAVSYTAYSRFALASLPLAHLERKYQKNNHDISTPEDIEEMRAEPSQRKVIRIIDRILDWLDTWFLEPILVCKRFVHVILLFSPIVIAIPIAFFGAKNPDEHDERSGTIWWYNLIMNQMELAGPTFIKLGQWAASRTDLFPLALCSRLGKLHSSVTPHKFSYTRRVIEDAFGGLPLHYVFSEFEETPIGVGAIAQVYRAKIRPEFAEGHKEDLFALQDQELSPNSVRIMDDKTGESLNIHTSVAVKVLHPRARKTVTRDLRIMHIAASTISLIPTLEWISLPDEVEKFGEMMQEQLDLRNEGQNLHKFNDLFKDNMAVSFPRPMLRFTTKSMLIEEFANGIPMSVFLEQAQESKAKHQESGVFDHKIADIGLDAFLHMLIFFNFIHADLHPGNIVIKFYKPSAYHKFQQAWSKLLGRDLKDDGDIAVERISAVRHDYDLMREELVKLKEEGYSPKLVFLDTGLVTELNEVNRRNFLDLFRAIAEFDGYKTGKLMVERCRTPELVIEPEVFALKMQHIVLDIKTRTFQLGQVKVANLLHMVMNMVRDHHVKLEGDFVNVVVSILLLEGIGRQLDPSLDLLKSAIPVLRDFSIKDGAKGALDRMKSVEDIKGATPWLKVWFYIEAREWLATNTRENEWMTLW
ncbi:hypothetical protein INT43_005118 [Umbelopsis isabellina]|uniref:ABC1 atypical kinase-like domain-containing protein n=1 Tax=Mortierella isabellina TaxID=91625 RepID=A0A8H7PH18_MORIS|nr:hypothetical protein INT43_005118 [Umbelopsis isabellina]